MTTSGIATSRWGGPLVLAAVLHAAAAAVLTQLYLGRAGVTTDALQVKGNPDGLSGTDGMPVNLRSARRAEPTPASADPLASEQRQLTSRLVPETPAPQAPPPVRMAVPPRSAVRSASSLRAPLAPPPRQQPPPDREPPDAAAVVPTPELLEVTLSIPAPAAPPTPGGSGPPAGPEAVGDLEVAYPAASIRRGEQGRVVIEAFIRTDGSVADARLYQSSSYPLLDSAALAAVRSAPRLPPLRRDGIAVDSWRLVPVRFVLR